MARKRFKARARAVYRVARKSYRRSGGIGSILKPALIGVLGGMVAPSIPVVNGLPYNRAISGAGLSYLLGSKGTKNMLVAAAAGQFLTPMVAGMMGGSNSSGNNLFDGGGY